MVTTKNEISFSRVIRINVALLKFSGTILPEDKTIFKMSINYCLTFISVAVLVIHTSVYIYEFINHAAYVETAIESFALIISLSGGLIRNIILYLSRGKVQEILKIFDHLWKFLNAKERSYVTSYIRSTKNLTYFFLSQCLFTIFFYSIAPLFVYDKSNNGNSNSTRVLPYAFFVQVQQPPYYEILYFLQVLSMLNVSFTCVGVDMIGPLLITTACGHFKVIQEQLKNIDYQIQIQSNEITGENHENCGRFLKSVSSKLNYSVNYHRTILKTCADIENLTNLIFLTQLVGSTYILSAVGFKLSGDDQDKYKYLSQIVIGVIQLLICNWPPDVLLTESQAVGEAIYSAPWYQWPNYLKKSVFIIILRAQKPIKLTAGKFVYLSLETFSSMISTAVSFFTLLRSLNWEN